MPDTQSTNTQASQAASGSSRSGAYSKEALSEFDCTLAQMDGTYIVSIGIGLLGSIHTAHNAIKRDEREGIEVPKDVKIKWGKREKTLSELEGQVFD
jgi:hypothetical protein